MFGLGPSEMIILIGILALFFFGKDKAIGWIRDIKEVGAEAVEEE